MTPEDIRAWRDRTGYSQSDLAAALGLPNPMESGRVQVARWESGTRHPAPYLWRALRDIENEGRDG